MPMNFDFRNCKNLTEETKKIFFTGGSIYNCFQTLCNWLYQTKFHYSDRKRDSLFEDNVIVMKEEHVDEIIESKLFVAVDPEKYNEESLKSMLKEWIGLKVWAN